MSSGRLFEDFFPIDDRLALITTGHKLGMLDRIELYRYTIKKNRVVLQHEIETIIHGESLRLGGMFDNQLVYSDANGVGGIEGKTAHQPFIHERSVYYTDDWPHVKIYKDGEVFVDHFDDMIQVGNPCWLNGTLYFEARNTDHPQAADQWKICRLNGDKPEVMWPGANPAGLENKLFWGEWNGKFFDYRCTEID